PNPLKTSPEKSPTVPGTLTNVTPDKDVPIIPKATSIQLLLRFPIKKESLFELREVYQATESNNTKYPTTKEKRMTGDID
ncbi:MAG: hypothetical protein ACRDEB_04960, partial [Chitinophagaceae bacterium]